MAASTSTFQIKLPKDGSFFTCANPIEPFKCLQCPTFETHNSADLKHHFKAVHAQGKSPNLDCFRCAYCSYKTRSQSLLDSHLRKRHEFGNDRLRKCQYCPYATKKTNHLKSHVLLQHTNPEKIQWFECPNCPYKTKTRSNLKQHAHYKHGSEPKFKCDQCAFQTNFKPTLNRHKLRPTRSSRIQCGFAANIAPTRPPSRYICKGIPPGTGDDLKVELLGGKCGKNPQEKSAFGDEMK